MHIEQARFEEPVLKRNDEVAAQNRRFFLERGIFCVNLMGAPGAGKTTLLERLIPLLTPHVSVAVVEGDIAGDDDARRIAACGVPVQQTNTYGACHLLAEQIAHAVDHLTQQSEFGLLFIENVGNLVCPAEFDLGEALRFVVYSATEGSDKPRKYPLMFMRAGLVALNKADIAGGAGVEMADLRRSVAQVNPAAAVFTISAATGDGVDDVAQWLLQRMEAFRG
ncbi:MAG: hydrogenase accessory protein HypB [Planctomycetota bacterium]|nr:MAG: hydrogenase accessory protein HypB [Planctomycetota bacterium]